MKKILGLLGFLCLVLSGAGASAGVTSIAQLPLLNINGTGNVRPNLMLLYDNSGSMAYTFTPDFVDDAATCRLYSKMWTTNRGNVVPTTQGCTVGHPPFNSADFNRQYYDPKVRYTPPVDATGKSYNAMTRTQTSNWTSVPTDGFGVNKRDLLGGANDNTNLVTGFPDLKWCDTDKKNCVYNTATYTYPNDNRYTGVVYYGNPYYYTINVAEWCTNTNMTNCKTTNVGDDAPADYPVPAKVRWCKDASLSDCRAKYSGDEKDSRGNVTALGYKYPRFANPTAVPVAAYGTITIGGTTADTNLQIKAITVAEPGGVVTISNGPIAASGGTNATNEQAALATAIAASITAKTGLTNQYVACVKTPSNSTAKACSEYGITNLATSNIVAVIPIDCKTGATNKDVGTCSVVSDDSRSGWTIGVDTDPVIIKPAQRPTAIVTVTGSGGGSTTLSGTTSLGDTALLSYTGNNSLSLKNKDANGVVSQLVTAIGTGGAIKAYAGGDTITDVCKGYAKNVLCLVDTSTVSGGKAVTMGTINNNGNNLKFVALPTSTPQASAIDKIPVTTTPLGAGAAIFVRTDVISSVNSYPKDLGRTDCAGTSCTYDEEMTNFANWYAYYKSRNQMMKTAVGQAFQSLTANYNVGIVSLSVAAAQGDMNVPKQFAGDDRAAWYTSLYGMNGNQSTPIRQALHSIGLMYANKENYEVAKSDAAVQYACQQNFTFITTDGYWNGNAAKDVVNNDNVASKERFCALDTGCLDTSVQSYNSLADVALYWYNGGSNGKGASLRTDLENWKEDGLVPAGAADNQRLHMNTYALGLGVDGVMNYEAKYDTFPVAGGDFYKLTNGVTKGCPWNNNGPYVWPDPKTGDSSGSAAYQSRVDDLWHAAINGHGKYFSASDPTQVVQGLSTALSNIQVRVGAAAAAATSTPNISQEDNDVFSSTFTTVKWFGQLSDRKIDTASGVVGDTVLWTTSDTVGLKVGDTTDTRDIRMLNVETGTLKPFKYDAMTATERAWFDNKCNVLAQCAGLSAANQAIVNDGGTIIDWLRGQQAYANDTVLRSYTRTDKAPEGAPGPIPVVLGDIASSKPAYLREPRKGYTSAEYIAFKNDAKVVARKPAVFVAANDGMLHAFDAKNGTELWAYVPRITMRKLPAQASVNYGLNHQFTTDGAPEIGDVKIGTAFHSVLVAGLNGGGRGFYALDVTDPANPAPLWELCADASLCARSDPDLGLSFGNPQFGTWKDANGVERWVVFLTSGYNNVPGTDGVAGGDGKGYLYVVDAATGQVLNKTSTGAGSVGTPSGFARITAITANPLTDPLVTYVYGGDNSGKMWRFDFSRQGAPAVLQMGDAGTLQPITTRPEVTLCQVDSTGTNGVVSSGVSNMVVFGTGRLLDVGDIADISDQSVYVLKDKGSGIAAANWRNDAAMSHQVLTKTKAGNYTIDGPAVTLGTRDGWYFDIDKNDGERVNLDPKVVAGTLNVVSNIPTNSTSCTVGGTSNLYQLDVCTGKPLLKDDTDGMIAGRALSTTSAAVGFIIVRLPSGDLKLVATTADGGNLTKGLPPAQAQDARKAGWRRVRD
jgi:type IV pilus assembly protein PilY1